MREATTRALATGQRGVALIAVLGFLAVMSLITIGVVGAARSVISSASRQLVRVQAQAAIESGVEWAAYTLSEAHDTIPSILAKPQALEIGGFHLKISARPERAKVDLNFADEPLLAAVFRYAGAESKKAEELASAVEDWRDGDDLVHLNGAERMQYLGAGLHYGPANRLFQSVGELHLLLGLTPAVFACVRPELTILTQSPAIDLNAAEPGFLKLLNIGSSQHTAGGPSLATGQLITPGDVYEIIVELEDAKRQIRRAERVSVRVTGNPDDPFWILNIEAEFPIRDAAERACPQAVDAADGAR